MAIIDIADHDLFELILATDFSEEKKQEIEDTYNDAFAAVTTEVFSKELKEKDNEDMRKLMQSKDITPDALDNFYKERIPQFEQKLTVLAIEFKKKFVITVYLNKIEEYTKVDDKYGLAAWEQVYYDAQHDNWNEVVRLLNIIKGMTTSDSKPHPPANG